jgi:hypothetical protein
MPLSNKPYSAPRPALASFRPVFVAPSSHSATLADLFASSLQHPGTLLHIATAITTLWAPPGHTQYVAGYSLAVTGNQKTRSQGSALGDLCDHSLSLLLPGSRAGQALLANLLANWIDDQ